MAGRLVCGLKWGMATMFTFTLPVPASHQVLTGKACRQSARGLMQRVLVIDDEAHIRHMMRLTLETAGYEVGEAADGPRGSRFWR